MKPQLSQILAALQEEFTTQLIAGHDEVEDQIWIDLGEDSQGRSRRLELVFLPREDELSYLQFFVMLPFAAPADRTAELSRLLLSVNLKLPLVGFGLSEPEQWIYYRTIMPCSHRELDAELVLHTIWLVFYMVERFSPIIEQLSAGNIAIGQAFESVERLLTSTE
jgi:hypothetical protein